MKTVFGGGGSFGFEGNVLHYNIGESDFKLQSCSYSHFLTNNLKK